MVGVLHPVYVRYFEWETKRAMGDPLDFTRGSETDLYKFLREFDICPSLISKSMISDVWT